MQNAQICLLFFVFWWGTNLTCYYDLGFGFACHTLSSYSSHWHRHPDFIEKLFWLCSLPHTYDCPSHGQRKSSSFSFLNGNFWQRIHQFLVGFGNTECLESANNGPHPTAKVYDAAGICITPLTPLSHKIGPHKHETHLYEKGVTWSWYILSLLCPLACRTINRWFKYVKNGASYWLIHDKANVTL